MKIKVLVFFIFIGIIMYIVDISSGPNVIDQLKYTVDDNIELRIDIIDSIHLNIQDEKIFNNVTLHVNGEVQKIDLPVYPEGQPEFKQYEFNEDFYIVCEVEGSAILLIDKKTYETTIYSYSRHWDLTLEEFLGVRESFYNMIHEAPIYQTQQELIAFFIKYDQETAIQILEMYKEDFSPYITEHMNKTEESRYRAWINENYETLSGE